MSNWTRSYLAGALGVSAGFVAATHWSIWLGVAIVVLSAITAFNRTTVELKQR